MILKMIISAILLYYLAVLWQYFRHDLMRSFWKTDAEEADDEPEEKRKNRTRLSEKAPTGRDKRTSRTTSKDTLIIKRIKRIISHPKRPETMRKVRLAMRRNSRKRLPESLRITARNNRKKPSRRMMMRTTPTSR